MKKIWKMLVPVLALCMFLPMAACKKDDETGRVRPS